MQKREIVPQLLVAHFGHKPFHRNRGIREIPSFSPYIFVLGIPPANCAALFLCDYCRRMDK